MNLTLNDARAFTRLASFLVISVAATAQEVVVLRSGQVNGGSGGSYGESDDRITCLSGSSCCDPLRTDAFDASDFAAAREGAPALLVKPHQYWLNSLPSDGEARWIHALHSDSSDMGWPPRSVLYAIPFQVQTGNPVARIELAWAVDNRLGDNDAEPNEAGAYVNGIALGHELRNISESYGNHAIETRAFVEDVPLHHGENVLYLYAREETGVVSGLLFRATILIEAGECDAIQWTHCTSLPNSTGTTASLFATGSLGIFDNDTSLHVAGCPAGEFGVFLHAEHPAHFPFASGILCLNPVGSGLFRAAPPMTTDAGGSASLWFDLASLPAEAAIYAGETRYFQFLFRDPPGGGAAVNLSDGLAITFCP